MALPERSLQFYIDSAYSKFIDDLYYNIKKEIRLNYANDDMLKKKMYIRIFMMFALFVFIYTTLGFTFIYQNQYKADIDRINNTNIQQLKQLGDNISTKLSLSNNLINKLCFNNDFTQYVQSAEKDYMLITDICKIMKSDIATFYELGLGVGVSKIKDDIIITADGSTNASWLCKERGYTEEQWGKISALIDKKGEPSEVIASTNENGQRYITIAEKRVILGRWPVITFMMFDEKELLHIEDDKNRFYIMSDKDFISGNPSDEIKSAINHYIEKYGTQSTAIRKQAHYNIGLAPIPEMGWSLVFVDEPEHIFTIYIDIFIKLLFLYLLFLIIGLCCAMLMSKQIYNPFSKIISILKNDDAAITGNEAEFIIERTKRLQQSNEELKAIIQNANVSAKQTFLYDWLKGMANDQDIELNLNKYHINWLSGGFFICMVALADYKNLSVKYTKDEHLKILDNVKTIFIEQLDKKTSFEMIDYNMRSKVCLMSAEDMKNTRKEFINISNYLEDEFGIQLIFILSKVETDISLIPSLFMEVLNVSEYTSVKMKNNVINTSAFFEQRSNGYYYPLEVEGELIDAVISGELRKVEVLVKNIISENFKDKTLDKNIVQKIANATVVTIDRIVNILDKSLQEVFGEDIILYLEMKMCNSMDELAGKIIEIYRTIINGIETKEDNLENILADNMIEYIHKNYKQDISLTDMSQEFNLSASYISTLFKNFTNYNFKDYLNQYRIDIAVQMLHENPFIKIKDLGEAVGYNSTNSFIRTFKKYKGVSPGQYAEVNH